MLKALNFMKTFPAIAGIIAILLWCNQAQAQGTCSERLRDAQNLFDAGKLEEVLKKLSPCLQGGTTWQNKDEEIQAHKTLALVYLYQDKRPLAEAQMEEILKISPLYKLAETGEVTEYVQLYNSYVVYPRISIGLKAGLNYLMPSIGTPYSVNNSQSYLTQVTSDSISAGYQKTIGPRGGIIVDLLLYDHFFLSAEALINFRKLSLVDQPYQFTELNYVETMLYIEFPVTVKYTIGNGLVGGFVRAGGNFSYLVSSYANITRSFPFAPQEKPVTSNHVNMKPQRTKLDYGPLFGAGISVRLGTDKLSLETRFRPGFVNITKSNMRYSETSQMFAFYYIHDDIFLNSLEFSLGYSHILYKIKKRKVKTN